MADQEQNTQQDAQENSEAQQSLAVIAQYIKDVSFENPSAPGSLVMTKSPKININVNVQARRLSETDHEVSLQLNGSSQSGDEKQFVFELDYCGVFRLQGFKDELLHPVALVECPRLLFPFARQILADLSRNAGFPPLMLDPIDFARLYRDRMQKVLQERQESEENSEPDVTLN